MASSVVCSGTEHSPEGSKASAIRAWAVEAAVEVLANLGLNEAEKTAVAVEMHRQLGEKEVTTGLVVVQATAMTAVGSARSELVLVRSESPGLVASALVDLAKMASPALWAEIQAVLAVEWASGLVDEPAAK